MLLGIFLSQALGDFIPEQGPVPRALGEPCVSWMRHVLNFIFN